MEHIGADSHEALSWEQSLFEKIGTAWDTSNFYIFDVDMLAEQTRKSLMEDSYLPAKSCVCSFHTYHTCFID